MLEFDNLKEEKVSKQKNRYTMAVAIVLIVCNLLVFTVIDIGTINGNSMNPTLMNGEFEISLRVKFREVRKGDIVNIDSVVLKEAIIKRAIATEGDHVQIINNEVYVNGEKLDEPYIARHQETSDYEVTVPQGYIFVMGDNRNFSADSRTIGCVSMAEVRSVMMFHFH